LNVHITLQQKPWMTSVFVKVYICTSKFSKLKNAVGSGIVLLTFRGGYGNC